MSGGDIRGGFLVRLTLFTLIALQLIPGLSNSTPVSKDSKANEPSKPRSTGREIFLICLGLAAFAALSVFIFKLYQKKKRKEQHARLLRLFEEDDELELELGLRD